RSIPTGPVTPTRSRDRWGRVETQRAALGEALARRRRTRVRFPAPPLQDHRRRNRKVAPPLSSSGQHATSTRGAIEVPNRALSPVKPGAPIPQIARAATDGKSPWVTRRLRKTRATPTGGPHLDASERGLVMRSSDRTTAVDGAGVASASAARRRILFPRG